jgi:neutral trehalase
VVRRGRWARRWQASHVESEAKRRQKQHRSAIDQRVLIFIGEPAAPSQHCRHTRCNSLFVSIDQRWPDIENQPNRDIPKPQVQKTMQRHEITVTEAVVI